MFSSRADSSSAILFFTAEGVVKELLYSEFEALLEGFTPEKEWAGKDARAVYLELSGDLKPKCAVFFTVAFDEEGWVEASWNIPLVNLARTAGPGPDLGAGPIRVATAKSCPDPRFQMQLWTPDLTPNGKIIKWILDALAINRLGLSKKVVEEPDVPADAPQPTPGAAPLGQGLEMQLAQLLQAQLQGASGVASTVAELEQTKKDYEQKLQALQQQLVEKVRQFDGARAQIENLEQRLEGQGQKLQEMKAYYTLKLEKSKGDETDYIRALREHYETESSQLVASAESEYKELLNWREVELMYRAEKESQLHQEIAELRQRTAELEQTSNDELLNSLSEKGITFMTYQVGLGHIAIPPEDVALYLSNPVGFVAAFCKVSEAVYLDWLAHYHAPVCRVQTDGELCGANITRVDSPEQFMSGVSDCCEKHRNQA